MIFKHCDTCSFYKSFNGSNRAEGRCYLNPPTVVESTPNGTINSMRPIVAKEDFCASWSNQALFQ